MPADEVSIGHALISDSLVMGIEKTGEGAIQSATQKKPDIIIMDIMLKGETTGIEAAEKIREDYNIPIIFLTAYADENTLARAKITEPYAYIIKPYKEIDLHTSKMLPHTKAMMQT